jgi:hypothetical protein
MTDDAAKAIASLEKRLEKLLEGWRQQQSAQHDEQLALLKLTSHGLHELNAKLERRLRSVK